MRPLILTLALGASTLATMAAASPGPAMQGPPGRGMMMADADRDGVVTRAEALAAADAMFQRMDTDRDGILTAAERSAAHERRRDARGPERRGREPAGGVTTRADFADRAGKRFDRRDADHDGCLDATELAARRGGPVAGAPGRPDAD